MNGREDGEPAKRRSLEPQKAYHIKSVESSFPSMGRAGTRSLSLDEEEGVGYSRRRYGPTVFEPGAE